MAEASDVSQLDAARAATSHAVPTPAGPVGAATARSKATRTEATRTEARRTGASSAPAEAAGATNGLESPTSPPDLERALRDAGPVAVAVSGGVDSLTLAVLAHRLMADTLMVHATSPAVPEEATARVRHWAAREGWRLEVVDAGEFADPAYRANPVNRCFFCKTNLYGAVRRLTPRQIVSGANLDDLQEYRPGLDAAREHAVRHPYIEAGIDKAGVRRLSAALGLGSVAELPSSPCLSSRVETGIAIDPQALRNIHAVERLVAGELAPRTVRCRVRATGVVVELDAAALAALSPQAADRLVEQIRALWVAPASPAIRFATYRTGSAFLIKSATPAPVGVSE